MSWSLSVAPTWKGKNFDNAVDAAEPMGQDASLPGVAEDVAAAKTALKALGRQCKRDQVGGNAGGHALQEEEAAFVSPRWHDGISVSVYGQDGAKQE